MADTLKKRFMLDVMRDKERGSKSSGASVNSPLNAGLSERGRRFLMDAGMNPDTLLPRVRELNEEVSDTLFPSQMKGLQSRFNDIDVDVDALQAFANMNPFGEKNERNVFLGNYALRNVGRNIEAKENRMAGYKDDVDYINNNILSYDDYVKYVQGAMKLGDANLSRGLYKYGKAAQDGPLPPVPDDYVWGWEELDKKEKEADDIYNLLARGIDPETNTWFTPERTKELEARAENLYAEVNGARDQAKADTEKNKPYFERYTDELSEREQAANDIMRILGRGYVDDPARPLTQEETKALYDQAQAMYEDVDDQEEHIDIMKSPEKSMLETVGEYTGLTAEALVKGLLGIGTVFNKTLDMIIGKPINSVVSLISGKNYKNPLERHNDMTSKVLNKWNSKLTKDARELGGEGAVIYKDIMTAVAENIPNVILAAMSGGTTAAGEMAAAGARVGANAAQQTIQAVGNMLKNPQYWASFARAAGSDYEEALEESGNPVTASLYSMVANLVNAGIEIGPTGTSGIQGIGADDAGGIFGKVYGAIAKGNSVAAVRILDSATDEAKEEFLQKLVSGMTKKVIYDSDKEWIGESGSNAIITPDVKRDMLVGFATGGLLSGAAEVTGAVTRKMEENAYMQRVLQYLQETRGKNEAQEDTAVEEARLDGYNERLSDMPGTETAMQYALSGRSVEELTETLQSIGVEVNDEVLEAYNEGARIREENIQKRMQEIAELNSQNAETTAVEESQAQAAEKPVQTKEKERELKTIQYEKDYIDEQMNSEAMANARKAVNDAKAEYEAAKNSFDTAAAGANYAQAYIEWNMRLQKAQERYDKAAAQMKLATENVLKDAHAQAEMRVEQDQQAIEVREAEGQKDQGPTAQEDVRRREEMPVPQEYTAGKGILEEPQAIEQKQEQGVTDNHQTDEAEIKKPEISPEQPQEYTAGKVILEKPQAIEQKQEQGVTENRQTDEAESKKPEISPEQPQENTMEKAMMEEPQAIEQKQEQGVTENRQTNEAENKKPEISPEQPQEHTMEKAMLEEPQAIEQKQEQGVTENRQTDEAENKKPEISPVPDEREGVTEKVDDAKPEQTVPAKITEIEPVKQRTYDLPKTTQQTPVDPQYVESVRRLNQGGETAIRQGTFRSVSEQEAKRFRVHRYSGEALSEKQTAAMTAVRHVAEKMHLNVAYFESPIGKHGERVGANGFYDPQTNTVYLDLFAGKNNEQAIMRAAAHEFTHVIKNWSPDKYREMEDMLVEYYYSTGKNTLKMLVQGQIEKAKAAGMTMSESAAMEEVVCDACELMFSDVDALTRIAQTDRTLFQKIGDWISSFIDAIKKAMEGIRGSTEESRLLRDNQAAWEKAQHLWYEALEMAGRNNPGSVQKAAQSEKTTQQRTNEAKAEKKPSPVRITQASEGSELTRETQRGIWEEKKAKDSTTQKAEVKKLTIRKLGNAGTDQKTGEKFRYAIVDWHALEGIYDDDAADTNKSTTNIPVVDKTGKLISGRNIPQMFNSVSREDGKKRIAYRGWLSSNAQDFGFDREKLRDTLRDDEVLVKVLEESEEAEQPVEIIGGSAVKNSLRTWTDDERSKITADLKKKGFDAKKIKRWIQSVDGIAATIAADKGRLDFKAADNQVMLKNNQEYVKTLDASTLCAKRLIYQGTFNAVQHALPDRVITSDDLIDLRNLMAKMGYETPCGICYVESRRRHLGKFANEWIEDYEGPYKPHLDDVTTTDGLERLRKNHPEAYESFMAAMKKKGSNNPKVVELRTEYRGDIKKMTAGQIKKIREIGGLRVQSFSDFETPHLLDMMQAVLDMSAKGLTSQAYTKVPDFAAVFGDTGIKINLSLIADGEGLDKNGNLIFSSYEGMDFDRAMELRNQYSENVGTILVGLNDDHIRAAMADDRIDFIIPFHKSGWGQEQMERLTAMRGYDDYTDTQNERRITGYRKNGKPIYKNVESNFYPEKDYWDFNVSGKKNAETYLQMCAEDGRVPKFDQFLVNNGDGSYSLPEDGSADGYWKLLIDYKMYDNDGKGAPQRAVTPEFNMDEAERVLSEYEGGADTLPVARDVVQEFVKQLQKKDGGNVKYSMRDTEYKTDRQLLADALENVAADANEAQMLREYQEIAAKLDADERRVQEINARIRELRLEDPNTPEEQSLLEERKGLEKGITSADRRLFQMERLKPLQRIAKIQRKEAEEKLNRAKQHLERYKEGVTQREYIGKIKRTSDRLAKWLTKPSNQRFVPEAMRKPLAEFLLAIDRSSVSQLTGGGDTKEDRDYARVVADLRDIISNINAYQNDQSESDKVFNMHIDLPRGFVDLMTEHARKMEAHRKEMGSMTLNQMNSEELKELFMTLTAISSSITHTNEFLSAENAKHVSEVSQETISYLRDQKPIEGESKAAEFLNWDNLQPIYAFERYGEGGKQIFKMLQAGQSKLAFNTQEIVDASNKLYTAKEAREWSEDVKTFEINGKKVQIPVANIMSLYCLMRRQQGIGHLYGEGIRVGDFKVKGKTVRDGGHNVGDADIMRMIGTLTERQKDVAEKLQRMMSSKGSAWGNEISMKRFGYRMFTEQNYFPIEVDKTHLPARTDNGKGNELYRLLNISSTKPITRGANNRIMLNNIFDVFSSHMSDMAQYNAMALPVLDAVKWLNYKESEMEEIPLGSEKEFRQKYTESVRDAARDAYGYAANKYIIGVLRDINGAQMTGGTADSFGKMMLGRANRASVAANLRVAFLQPLSIIRAGMVLGTGDIIKGAGIGATRIRQNIKEMQEHSGIAAWKDLGFFDINIGRSVSKLIKHDESKMDKVIDASMKGAEWTDKITWALMWEGAKQSVAKQVSPGSQDYMQKVAEKFEEVVYKTQVVDSVLTKSQYMRNPSFVAKWTSSFMSEPTTTYNTLLNAYSKFAADKRNSNFQQAWLKNKKLVLRTMAVYVVTAAVNAVVESLIGAARDEDDYETFAQKFSGGVFDNFVNNLMPFNKIPLINDLYEYAKRYMAKFGVDTYGYSDSNGITQWLDQLESGVEIIADKVNGNATNYTDYGAIYKIAQGLSSGTGIPVASAMREVAAIWNNTIGALTKNKIVVYKTSKTAGYKQMYNAVMDGNDARAETIKTELLEDGAEEKNIFSGLRSAAKEDFLAGDLTDEEALDFLQKHTGLTEDEAYWKLEEWTFEEAEDENFRVYSELEEALLTGTGVEEAVKKLTSHGYKEDDVRSKVRSIIKEGYMNGDLSKSKTESLLKKYGEVKTDNEVWFKFQQYEYERLTDESTTSDACMIFYAIDQKRSPQKEIDAAKTHGKSESSLASSITNRYKPQYLQLLKTNPNAAYALRNRLAGIFDYLGYKGLKKVDDWAKDNK